MSLLWPYSNCDSPIVQKKKKAKPRRIGEPQMSAQQKLLEEYQDYSKKVRMMSYV